MFHIVSSGHRYKATLFTAVAAFALWLPSIPSAIASCNTSAPYLLNLYLSGQKLSETIYEQRANLSSRNPSLSALYHAFSKLNTNLWGLYWINIYSRRLHEVLEKLDTTLSGPVTQYYERWDGAQLAGSSSTLKGDVDIVDKLLPQTEELPPETIASLKQYLRQIESEIAGCILTNSQTGQK